MIKGYPRHPKVIVDLPAYMREKNRQRRAAAKRLGICISCASEKALEGRTKCEACLSIEAARIKSKRLLAA